MAKQICCVCKSTPDASIDQETRLYTATVDIRKFKKGDLVCGLCTIALGFTAQEGSTFRHLPEIKDLGLEALYEELEKIAAENKIKIVYPKFFTPKDGENT